MGLSALHHKTNRVLACAFYGVYTVSFGWVAANIALTTTGNSLANLLLALLLGLGLWLLMCRAAPRLDALGRKPLNRLVALCLGLYAALLLVMGWFLMTVPQTDLLWVMEAAAEVIEQGRLSEYNWYFALYPNNFGLLLLLIGLFGPLRGLGVRIGGDAAYFAGTALNVAAIVLSVWLVWRLAGRLLKSQSAALLALLLCFLFAPYLLWAPYFYTDTLVMPFHLGALALYLRAREKQGWRAAGGYALCGVVLVAGYCLKGSAMVTGVAIAIHTLLTAPLKRALVRLAALAAAFGSLLAGFTFYTTHNTWFDASAYEETHAPISIWLAMASHNAEGFCSCARCGAIQAMPVRAERAAAAWAWVRESYGAYTETELVAFMAGKAVRAWGTGDYEALHYIKEARRGNWTHAVILPTGPLYAPLSYWCSAFNLLLLGLLMAGLLHRLRRGRFGGDAVVHLVLFGGFLFFLFWENQPRFILQFTPCLIIAAAGALARLALRPRKKENAPAAPDGPAAGYPIDAPQEGE